MGTYDNRGGSALSPEEHEETVYKIEDDILNVLEEGEVDEKISHKVVAMVHDYAEKNEELKSILTECVNTLSQFKEEVPSYAKIQLLNKIAAQLKNNI